MPAEHLCHPVFECPVTSPTPERLFCAASAPQNREATLNTDSAVRASQLRVGMPERDHSS
jgi:hypothetical protein